MRGIPHAGNLSPLVNLLSSQLKCPGLWHIALFFCLVLSLAVQSCFSLFVETSQTSQGADTVSVLKQAPSCKSHMTLHSVCVDQGHTMAFLTYLHLLTTISLANKVNNRIPSWQNKSERFNATFLVKFNSNVDLINLILVSD